MVFLLLNKVLFTTQTDISDLLKLQMTWRYLSFYLAGNSLKCDCSLLSFIIWQNNGNCRIDVNLCRQSDLLNSTPKLAHCPDACSCQCTKQGNISFMFVDCSSRNLTDFPVFLKNNLMQVKVSISYITMFI